MDKEKMIESLKQIISDLYRHELRRTDEVKPRYEVRWWSRRNDRNVFPHRNSIADALCNTLDEARELLLEKTKSWCNIEVCEEMSEKILMKYTEDADLVDKLKKIIREEIIPIMKFIKMYDPKETNNA